jgi:DNA-directed RNA polymerase specialized sigma24 family protein
MSKTSNDVVESRILECLQAGELSAAFVALERGYQRQFLGRISSKVRHDDLEEVYQRFCERVWKSLPSFQGRSSVRTWASRIVAAVIADYHDERRRRPVPCGGISATEGVAAPSVSTPLAPTSAGGSGPITQLSRDLSPLERKVLARSREGARAQDIAAELEIGREKVYEVRRSYKDAMKRAAHERGWLDRSNVATDVESEARPQGAR